MLMSPVKQSPLGRLFAPFWEPAHRQQPRLEPSVAAGELLEGRRQVGSKIPLKAQILQITSRGSPLANPSTGPLN